MRHLVTIQAQPDPEDAANQTASGAPVTTWVNEVEDVPCEVVPQTGREFLAAQQVNDELTHLVRMRYLAGFTPVRRRLLFGSRVLNILSVANLGERNREMQVQCKELVGA